MFEKILEKVNSLTNNQKIALVERILNKKLVGVKEQIKVFGPYKVAIETKARIDSGARKSSIDVRLAEKAGFKKATLLLQKLKKVKIMNKNDGKKIIENIEKNIKNEFKYVSYLDVIKSSHGYSIRPIINVKLELAGNKFETEANLYDRSHMTFSVLVGRNSLDKFIVCT